MTSRSPETPALRLALWAAILAGSALLAIPLFVHSDDGDAQLYQVISRHMVEDHTWTNLRYLGNVFTVFREHLPFGFWPYALAIRTFGEGALGPVALGFSISTLLLVAFAARRLAGDGAALVAVISLAACDSFWSLGGRPRLDPPLVLFANLAALPVLLGPRRATGFLWAWGFGTCAALIKGPFGLVPLTAAAIAQASVGRWRTFLLGGVVTAAATIPMVAFLVHDRSHGGTWWQGYVENQLLASATGSRSDGEFAFYVPLRTVLTRFWPGLPLLAIGVWRLLRRGGDEAQRSALKLLAVFGLAMVAILCVPTRKLWFHALVAFPGLAMFAGAAVGAPLEAWLARGEHRARNVALALGAIAAVLWVGNFTGLTRLISKKPSPYCSVLGPALDPAVPKLLVVGPKPWNAASTFAAERPALDVRIELASTPAVVPGLVESASYAGTPALLADDSVLPLSLPGWRRARSDSGWTLLLREPNVH